MNTRGPKCKNKRRIVSWIICVIVAAAMIMPGQSVLAVTGSQIAKDGTYSARITATKSKSGETKSGIVNVYVSDGKISNIGFSGSDAKDFQKYLNGEKGRTALDYFGIAASQSAVDAVSSATSSNSSPKYTIDLKSALKTALLYAEEAQSAQEAGYSNFKDGAYSKNFSIGSYNATVSVIIADGKISDINIEGNGNWDTPLNDARSNLKGASSTVGVDAISSATQYSQSLEDAIMDALKQASDSQSAVEDPKEDPNDDPVSDVREIGPGETVEIFVGEEVFLKGSEGFSKEQGHKWLSGSNDGGAGSGTQTGASFRFKGVSAGTVYVQHKYPVDFYEVIFGGQLSGEELFTIIVKEPSEYTVTFADGQGNTLKTQIVAHGNGATAPADPERENYTFTGWDEAFTNITSDMTITAQWSENEAKINYVAAEGGKVGRESETVKVVTGTIAGSTATADPNYEFIGWTDESGKQIGAEPRFVPLERENATYTANFKKKTHSIKVTFKVVNGSWNDGTSVDKSVTLIEDIDKVLSLASDQIPAAGSKPSEGYAAAGSWSADTPSAGSALTNDTIYTYTYKSAEGDQDKDKDKDKDKDTSTSPSTAKDPGGNQSKGNYSGKDTKDTKDTNTSAGTNAAKDQSSSRGNEQSKDASASSDANVSKDQNGGQSKAADSDQSKAVDASQNAGTSKSDAGKDKSATEKINELAKKLGVAENTLKITNKAITSMKGDGDIKGSSFSRLKPFVKKQTKKSVTLKWTKVKGADGYMIYGNRCNSKGKIYKLKLLKTAGKNAASWTQKRLKKGTYYKYMVIAYKKVDGEKVTIAAGPMLHAATSGGKYCVAKSVKITKLGKYTNKTKITLKKGKAAKIKAKEVKKNKKLKLSKHRKLCFESSNIKVAKVSKSGKIAATGKGKCKVWVYAQNGVYKTISVTVK